MFFKFMCWIFYTFNAISYHQYLRLDLCSNYNRAKIMEIIPKGCQADAINDSSSSLLSILFVVIKFAFVLTNKYGYSRGFFD